MSDSALIQQLFGQLVDFLIDERAGYQAAELVCPFTIQLVFEWLVAPFGQKCIVGKRKCRCPYHILDTVVRRFPVVVLAQPPRKFIIISRTAPFSGIVIKPESTVPRVPGTQYGGIAERRDGIDQTFVAGSYFQLVGNSRGQ